MIKTIQHEDDQIHQGDIFRDVECIERADEKNGQILISKISYPYVIILSQECDLRADFEVRSAERDKDQMLYADKLLANALAVPLYNYTHFQAGNHLENLGYSMSTAFTTKKRSVLDPLEHNEVPRYHYFRFSREDAIVDCVADFKHFFTVSLSYLYEIKEDHKQISIDIPFRERISQRLANYLSRIGLPVINA